MADRDQSEEIDALEQALLQYDAAVRRSGSTQDTEPPTSIEDDPRHRLAV